MSGLACTMSPTRRATSAGNGATPRRAVHWGICCTDGLVYGPLKAETCFALGVQLTESTNIEATYIASSNGDGTASVFVAGNANDLIRFEGYRLVSEACGFVAKADGRAPPETALIPLQPWQVSPPRLIKFMKWQNSALNQQLGAGRSALGATVA